MRGQAKGVSFQRSEDSRQPTGGKQTRRQTGEAPRGKFLPVRKTKWDGQEVSSGKAFRILALVASALLWAGALAYLGKGFSVAWRGGDSDLRIREREWVDFEKGIYPNRRYSPPGKPAATAHSVYPAYALVQFAPFFAFGDFVAARVLLQILSLAGLAVMSWLGWRLLREYGWEAGVLGMTLGPAISGNCTAIALGQFSILCAGLLAAQFLALLANRNALAGVFWALAMIKPQIALPFALLFIVQGRWRGLLAGGAVLGVLTLGALEWTGWSLREYLQHTIGTERLHFAKQGNSLSAFLPQLPPRWVTGLGIGLVAASAVALAWLGRRVRPEMLPVLAGVCAMLGWVFFYHRQYDNQMLFPLMLAAVMAAFCTKTIPHIALACLLAATLYLPAGMVAKNPLLAVMALSLPVVAAVGLLFLPGRSTGAPTETS